MNFNFVRKNKLINFIHNLHYKKIINMIETIKLNTFFKKITFAVNKKDFVIKLNLTRNITVHIK